MLCIISFTISTLILCVSLYLIYCYLKVVNQIKKIAEGADAAFIKSDFSEWMEGIKDDLNKTLKGE